MSVAWQASLFGSETPAVDLAFEGIRRVELAGGAWVDHLPRWLRGADVVMDELVSAAPWKESSRPMYDRIVAVPRLTCWWKWTGAYPAHTPPIIGAMRNALSAHYDAPFASCGCNLYRDGADSVAWHGDRMRNDLPQTHVAIVSVGEPRKLLLRPAAARPERPSEREARQSVGFRLGHGDLLVMGGTCQHTWQHAVPKCAAAGPRLSITFRHGGEDPSEP